MVDMAHIAGLIAAGVHPSPVPYADVITSTTHKTLRGPRGGLILCKQYLAKAIDKAIFPVVQGGPLMHIIAAKAVAFKEAMEPPFVEYSRQVVKNAQVLAENLASAGFRIVSGGTDTHLLLVDLAPLSLTGKEVSAALDQVGITCNKNAIPFDSQPPNITSGIRLGTPSVTSRGLGEREMEEIAHLIAKVIHNLGNEKVYSEVENRVKEVCDDFPVPGIDN